MDDTVLLTDDEIVALCAIDGRPWPLGLITVEPTPVEVSRAGMRGMRSLLVRQYATQADGAAPQPNAAIARFVTSFLDSRRRVGAYVAPVTDPATLSGASVTAVQTEDGWVLDSATAAGVHALRSTSAEGVAEAVLALVGPAEEGTLFAGEPDPSRWACVVAVDADQSVVTGDGSAAARVRETLTG